MLIQKLPLISLPQIKQRTISALFNGIKFKRNVTHNYSILCAVEKESDFELDRDKAREALQQLDQQLQSLSKKEVTEPRKKVSSSNTVPEADDTRATMKEDMPEFSEPYFAAVLLALTVFYNVLFLTVIKPAIDGQ